MSDTTQRPSDVVRLRFAIEHRDGETVTGEVTASETTGVVWRVDNGPHREVLNRSLDLRDALVKLIAEFNANDGELHNVIDI